MYALACTCIYKILVAELFDLGPEGADGERGTGLVDALQFAVADNLGIGIVLLQGAEQREEGLLLGRGAGVGGAATFVEASLVADADGVGIVVAGVGADHLLGTAEMQLSVAGDVVVTAAALPTAGLMHLAAHCHGAVDHCHHPLWCRCGPCLQSHLFPPRREWRHPP